MGPSRLPISQGLKAGLAAGVIYGLLIGVLHLGFQTECSADQIQYITQQLALRNLSGNVTAQQIFSTDLVVLPIYWGIGSLILGIAYGVVFSLAYKYIPGVNSKRKGLTLSVPVFLLGYLFGVSGYGIACTPSYLSYLPLAISLPISLVFGYVLGIFYDSFGRLSNEEKAEEMNRTRELDRP